MKMTPEEWRFAQQMIQAECPTLFRKGERTPGHRNDGNFYFECESGWHEPIRECAQKLEAIAKKMPEPKPGELDKRPRAEQIKEKFGGLRFYITGEHTPEVISALYTAEAACSAICEMCGSPGYRRDLKWIRTLCDKHFEQKEGS